MTVLPAAMVLALLIDRWWGEPPVRWHPVVWMGQGLDAMGRRIAPAAGQGVRPNGRLFLAGALAWTVGAGVVVLIAWVAAWALGQTPWWVQALALGVLLKPMLAWRMLRDEVRAVETALGESLAAGRERLARGW